MPRTYSEVIFTLVDLKIAAYDIIAGTYGSPLSLDESQTFEFSPVADNDSIKAQGRLRHLLSVITHVEFKLSQAGIDFEAYAILTGMSNTSSGSSPNASREAVATFSGAPLPYFGLVGKILGENGADIHLGLPVCMLDSIPGMKFEQNKFAIGESSGKGIARESDNKGVILLGHQTAGAIDFNQIFHA